jgi:hypothetical protein
LWERFFLTVVLQAVAIHQQAAHRLAGLTLSSLGDTLSPPDLVARGKTDRRFVRLLVGVDPVPLKEVPMKRIIVPVATVLLVALAQVVFAEPPGKERGKELAALEEKMLGEWKGRGCDGRFIFRADGTYELKEYGPAPHDSAGTWKVRWDALPPTLVLTCKTSEIPEVVGKTTEVKLINLDDKSLTIDYVNQNSSPSGQYTRVKK